MIERQFATLYGKVRALMNSAGFDQELRGYLWAHFAKLVTQLETILVAPDKP